MIKTKFKVESINPGAQYNGNTYTYSTKIRGENDNLISVFDPVVACSGDLEEGKKYEGILTGLVLTEFEGGYCKKTSKCSSVETRDNSGLKICGEVLGTEIIHNNFIDSENEFVSIKCADFTFNVKKEHLISNSEFDKVEKGEYIQINYIRPDLEGIIDNANKSGDLTD